MTSPETDAAPLRIGLVGMDTSHVPAFTKLFHDPAADGDLAGFRVVAGLPDGSDLPMSKDRIAGFTEEARTLGVEIVSSVDELVERSDRLMIVSVDGRIHLRQARELFGRGLPVFVDKPVAGNLAECLALAELAERTGTPWFSSSSTRFGEGVAALSSRPDLGSIRGATSWGPLAYQVGMPELFFYGIHGIEALFAAMGSGCESVSRKKGPIHDLVVGTWSGGRIGVYRGIVGATAGYGVTAYGEQGFATVTEEPSYEALCRRIGRFFRTGEVPVAPAETLEIYAFMEAADESLARGGAEAGLAETMARAAAEAG
jgi:hypothetical protein